MNRIEFKKVRFRNFLSYGSKWQEISFLNGINVIIGEDKDTGKSNGSGKSSLMETIPFALFGSIHSEVKQEDIINRKSKKKLEVELYLSKDGIDYRIYRSLKPNKLEIWKNGELVNPPSHVKLYQEQLEEIFGINKRTYSKLIHSNINSSNQILSMNKTDKRKFMEEMFGLEIYAKLQKLSNEKLSSIEKEISDITQKISSNNMVIVNTKDTLKDVKDKLSNIKSSKEEMNKHVKELEKLKNQLMDEEEYQEYLKEYQRNKNEYAINTKEKEAITTKIQMLKGIISGLNKKLSGKVRKKPINMDIVQKKKEEILNEKKDISKNINKVLEKKAKTEYKLSLETERGKLKGKDICPTCGQEMDESLHNNIQENINRYKEEFSLCKNQLEEYEDLQSNNNDRIEKVLLIEKEAERITKQNEDIAVLENELDIVNKDLSDLIERKETVNSSLEEINQYLSLSGVEISVEKEYREKIDQLKKDIEYLGKNIMLEEKTKDEFQSIIENGRKQIGKLSDINTSLKKDVAELNNTKDHIAYIKNICKDENAKSLAISKSRPILEKNTNKYLSDIGFNFYLKLDSWLNASINGINIKDGDYKSLSSGEKKTVDLALQSAFLDIARIQADVLPDILIFDEVLDSSIDGKGLSKVVDIIRNKEKKDRLKVFIISHRDDISEIEPDNIYNITKKDGCSVVEVK